MSQTTKELKGELKKSVGLLYTLKDEIKVKIHLAGMDAKDEWTKIEPQVAKLETDLNSAADEIDGKMQAGVEDIVQRLQKLRAKLS